jgi:hypothetical protein
MSYAILDLGFSGVAAKSKFVVFRPSARWPLERSKGDHVRRLVIIAAVVRRSSADAEIRSPCGYLRAD